MKNLKLSIILLFLTALSLNLNAQDDNFYIKRSSLKKTSYPYWVEVVEKDGTNINSKSKRNDSGYILIKTSGGKITEFYKLIVKRDAAVVMITSYSPNKWCVLMTGYTPVYTNLLFKDFMSIDPSGNNPLTKTMTEQYFNANHDGGAAYMDVDAAAILTGTDTNDIYGNISISNIKILNQ